MANPVHAVLVHKLPSDCLIDVLSLFPKEHIGNVNNDKAGLRIYFKNYEKAKECILRRTIQVQESKYTICPLVTNLTVHGIRKHASKLTIRDIMSAYGCVIDLYPVEELIKVGNFETKSLTDDYRVILEVPEIQINFKLSPLQLPDLKDHPFAISFFCRLCRQNGHMQFQCSGYAHCSVYKKEEMFQNGYRTESQRSCPENICSENSKGKIPRLSNCQNNLQVSREKTLIQMNPMKRQESEVNSNNKPDEKFVCNQAEINSTRATDSFSFESQNIYCNDFAQRLHPSQINELDINIKDAVKLSPMFNKREGASNIHLHEDFTTQPSIGTIESNMKYAWENWGQEEKMSHHKNKPPKSNNLPEDSIKNIWSRIIPPEVNPEKTKRLLIAVYKTHHLDIPQTVEWKLQELLEWNLSRGEKYLKKKDRRFLNWLEQYLAKVSRERTKSSHSRREEVYQIQNSTDAQISDVEKKKRRGVVSLCPEIERIVLKTSGVLDPILLRNFLNQVRGRRKQLEIATHFEKDILALSSQLNEVEKSYYLYGKRGAREDNDIDFIKRLRNRLMQESTAKEEGSCPSEQPSFKKQSSNKKVLSLNYNSRDKKNVDYSSQERVQTSALQMTNDEFKKYNHKKNFPGSGQPFRTSKSSQNFRHTIGSKNIFQPNLQRASSYDRHRFINPSTERKRKKNFRRIDKNEAPSESKFKKQSQILDSKKSSRSENDPKGKFEANIPFPDSPSTSLLNDSISKKILEVSLCDVEGDKRTSNKRPSYTTQYSTSGDSLPQYKQNLIFDNPISELLNVRKQSSSAEELAEISKNHLRKMMSFVQQSNSAEESFEITKEYLRNILSGVQQSTENHLRKTMSCVQQSNSDKESFEITKEDLRKILSCAQQSTENLVWQ